MESVFDLVAHVVVAGVVVQNDCFLVVLVVLVVLVLVVSLLVLVFVVSDSFSAPSSAPSVVVFAQLSHCVFISVR